MNVIDVCDDNYNCVSTVPILLQQIKRFLYCRYRCCSLFSLVDLPQQAVVWTRFL